MKYPKFYKLFDRKIYYEKSKYACQNADKIIAISKQTKEDIIKFFNINPEKISVIYQGSNDYFSSPQKKPDILKKYEINHPFILYVGTIEKRKNLQIVIKAIKDLKEVNLVCIGKKTNYYKTIARYIKTNNLQNKIFFPNVDNMLDLSYIYKESKGLIFPSIYEGFGKPIIEALYSEIPVISTNKKIFKEVGGPHSYYFEYNNKDQLIELIKKIWTPSKELTQKIELSRKYVEKFNNNSQSKKLIEMYHQLM